MAGKTKKVRYAVVGLGHIAQVAVLPAFAHARRNSMLSAIVSGDSTKRRESETYELTVDGKKTRKAIGKRDQFAPELLYFSDCILNDRSPEPSGEEGLQDVRVVEALYRSAQTHRAVKLPEFRDSQKPTLRQKIERPGVRKPRLIKAVSSTED